MSRAPIGESPLEARIIDTLARLREARTNGSSYTEHALAKQLNRLIDQLPEHQ